MQIVKITLFCYTDPTNIQTTRHHPRIQETQYHDEKGYLGDKYPSTRDTWLAPGSEGSANPGFVVEGIPIRAHSKHQGRAGRAHAPLTGHPATRPPNILPYPRKGINFEKTSCHVSHRSGETHSTPLTSNPEAPYVDKNTTPHETSKPRKTKRGPRRGEANESSNLRSAQQARCHHRIIALSHHTCIEPSPAQDNKPHTTTTSKSRQAWPREGERGAASHD